MIQMPTHKPTVFRGVNVTIPLQLDEGLVSEFEALARVRGVPVAALLAEYVTRHYVADMKASDERNSPVAGVPRAVVVWFLMLPQTRHWQRASATQAATRAALTAAQLSEALNVKQSNLSGALAELQRRGYLERSESPYVVGRRGAPPRLYTLTRDGLDAALRCTQLDADTDFCAAQWEQALQPHGAGSEPIDTPTTITHG